MMFICVLFLKMVLRSGLKYLLSILMYKMKVRIDDQTMGLLTIGEVEGPREKELRVRVEVCNEVQEAIEKRVFSDITGIVEYAYNVLNNYVVCYYFIRKF